MIRLSIFAEPVVPANPRCSEFSGFNWLLRKARAAALLRSAADSICKSPKTIWRYQEPMSITKANYVLVDFENVQRIDPQRFAGLPVTVVLFLGENQKNVSRDIFKHVVNNPGSITLVESIGSGKNALDFQIALYAGMLAERDPSCYIHFLSKDKGFDVLVEALRFQKRLAARADSFEELKLFKRVTLDATTSPSGLAAIVAEKFAKGSKPQKRSTLESSIRAILGTDVETEAVINALVSEEYLAFDEKGRISYSEKITSLASIK